MATAQPVKAHEQAFRCALFKTPGTGGGLHKNRNVYVATAKTSKDLDI